MNEPGALSYTNFILPSSIVSRLDITRLVTELERVDAELLSAAVHAKVGVATYAQPVLSDQLTDFLVKNSFTLNDSHARTALIQQIRILKDKVPVMHMTFAATADYESLQKIAQWLRASVHPQVVIAVGLQPSLVGGVYLRTPNHIHDMSLRTLLHGRSNVLVKELEAMRVSD